MTEKFLYFNDDILLTSPTSQDDFCFGWNGQKIRKDGPVSKCARGCNWPKMGDGICQVLLDVQNIFKILLTDILKTNTPRSEGKYSLGV